MKAKIEEYSRGDIPDMVKIWNEIVEGGEAFPQEEILDMESGATFFNAQSYCGICRKGEDIAGLYILHPNNVGRCGHICNASFAVARAERGRGLGRLLVQDCLRQAARLGFGIIQFNAVVADNLAAHTLYKSLGFLPLGTVKGGFRSKNGQMKDICLYWRPLRN